MGRWRMIGFVLVAVLATSGFAQPTETPPPFVPCPRADVDRPDHVPPAPEPPPHAPGDREIGGLGLDTDGLAVSDDAPAPPDEISATSWLVADLDNGTVYGACAPFAPSPPASTIKLLLALALLDDLDPEEMVEVIADDMDFTPGSSAVGVVPGGEYDVETLWLGLLLNSGNDAANVLARIGGGDEGVEGTLARMNEVAGELGANQTHAATPSGLDGPDQFTSAYDLALITRALFDREDFPVYIATERTDIPEQPDVGAPGFQIQNNNRLLFNYDGAIGGKPGYTDVARQTFVGVAERDGRRLVVTLLGAEREPMPSWQQSAELLDWAFSLRRSASVGRLVEPADLVEAVSATDAPTDTVHVSQPAPPREDPFQVALVASVIAGVSGLVVLGAIIVGVVRARRRS